VAVPRGSSARGDRAVRATRIRGERPAEPVRRGPLPPADPVDNPTRPRGLVVYELARRATLDRLRGAARNLELAEACDADPYLLRAARYHGEVTERPCPVCARPALVHVTYVFGDELGPYSGRVKASSELPEMAYDYGEFRVYVVEVCTGCGWNHLTISYALGDGVPRRARPRAADLSD
jgi:hypothetical protein